MVRKKASIPQLGELELAVMHSLWRAGEADVQETHASVGSRRGISVNTVGSAMERLHKKGLVAREKVSHAYRYRPAIGREAFAAQRMVDAAGGLRALSQEGLLAAFVDLLGDADESSLEELQRLVRQKRRERDA